MWRRGEPRAPQYLNVNFIGPAIMRAGTDEQKRHHLPRIAAGDVLWCQAFSEPDAGSDLSRIRTRARKVDGGYRVSGTKLWISYADVAEYGFLLARLDRPGGVGRMPRIVLLTPMKLPGIAVREVPSVVGAHTFHEVTFDDVFVRQDALLGDEETGWSVVTKVLADERVGAPEYMQAEGALDRVLDLFAKRGSVPSEASQARFGDAYTRCHAARLLAYRAVDERVQQDPPTTAPFVARAYAHTARQACAEAILGALAELDAPDLLDADVEPLNAILAGVAGGAYEILLDLVAAELTGIGPG
jgi:alkylation response protein AidB-like acyl-CoA dehydrogenase